MPPPPLPTCRSGVADFFPMTENPISKHSAAAKTNMPPPMPKHRRSSVRSHRSSQTRRTVTGRRSVASIKSIQTKRCRYLRRNWLFLALVALGLAGIILAAAGFLEPCPLVEVTTKTNHLAPVDVVFLLDSSGSMNGAPFAQQLDATSTLLRTLIESSNHTFQNGTFQASVVQWSGEEQASPGENSIFVDQPLNNNSTNTLNKLSELPHRLKGWTHFSPGLAECSNQLSQSGQEDSFKLCVLVSDGVNFDGDDYTYNSGDGSNVDEFCTENSMTLGSFSGADVCTDVAGGEQQAACAACVEAADAWCVNNDWDDTCRSICTSSCASACPPQTYVPPAEGTTPCQTKNIASTLKEDGIHIAGILVFDEGATGDQAEANVKGLSNCANSTLYPNSTDCPFYFRANDFNTLQASASAIAESLASEIVSSSTESTAFVCLGDARYLNFLLLLLPLLAYLTFKPLQFTCRKAIHSVKKRRLSVQKEEIMNAPPPPPPKREVIVEEEEVVVEEVARESVRSDSEVDDIEAPPPQPVEGKRFKWDIPSSDKYIWTSSKGVGHMPVSFETSTNKQAPPSAPKDIYGVKGKKTLRQAKKWETPDFVQFEKQIEEKKAKIEEREDELIEEEEQLELRISNVYNGDDIAEVIADAVVDVTTSLFCGGCFKSMCGCCGCCCCKPKEDGEGEEDGGVDEDLEAGTGGGADDDDDDVKSIGDYVWRQFWDEGNEEYYYFNSNTGETCWESPGECLYFPHE
ncbi:hypothetical protein TrVE_jg6600 [Triparma verrucosa]|uniref:WW domain-containing protein n=1 Tax=Triparma verrucosa TaxID=1606542 RepID=A0A9W7EYC1_9STRA|nr:hypothetical protein TrVE_jg6600 [Triparma verrucosa]